MTAFTSSSLYPADSARFLASSSDILKSFADGRFNVFSMMVSPEAYEISISPVLVDNNLQIP